MRFKKGTKVEVLTKSSVPSGAWRSAEIISGNGHYYTVMYDSDEGTTERVPRKSMRPEPPPPSQVLHSWAPGDLLEVLESCSWKMAIVSKVLENDCVLVRLLGSSEKVKANKCDIRVRQSWQDNQWFMVGQGPSSPQTSTGKLRRRKVNLKGEYVSSESKDQFNESRVFSTKGPKKRTYSLVEPHKEEQEDDRDSVASSVGSCSMDMDGLTTASFGPIETGNSSDTESSSCGHRSIKNKKLSLPANNSEAADVHRLELDEYRSSIERLHASGPNITWEQETWITNLRLRLNISNEEHLMQIRNLISDDNSTTYR
ncbi:ENT domain-containing protein [Hirschfeldia incana]|nr:ENT domain-containing protein [Hirschfeldia incana]KAJ0261233.1 ENT domain-containing protein [Hirschfeldia incana]